MKDKQADIAVTGSSGCKVHRVPKDPRIFHIGSETHPALTVPNGARCLFETLDCFSGMVRNDSDCFISKDACLDKTGGLNPITGPVYVAGARAGDFLEVRVESIRLGDQCVVTYIPQLGMLSPGFELIDQLACETRICRIRGGVVELPTSKRLIEIPVKPMIGTLWTAPPDGVLPSFQFDSHHLGNVDCPDLIAGNTVVLPVASEGGLLALGDIHAVQGDGEITGVAVEASAEVELVVRVLAKDKAQYVSCPQINGDDFIGSVGCHFGDSISENIKTAYYDLLQRLFRYFGFTPIDAYHLLGQVGEVRVCQVLGEHQAALVRVRREYIS